MYIHRWSYLLDAAGVWSRVIQAPAFDVWWDANPVPNYIIANDEVPTEEDTVIIPEVLFPMPNLKAKRKIVMIQNYVWITPNSIQPDTEVLVCSRHLFNYVQRVYGVKPIGKITPYLCDVPWRVTAKWKDRVLIMARRNDHWRAMIAALDKEDFSCTVVGSPISQAQLADQFDNCEFYVHLVYPEGFPMICLEAMRSGTIVVGTTGGGGNEFMWNSETARVVQDPKVGRYSEADFIEGIMAGLRELRSDPETRERIWKQGHEWSLRYTAEATTKELLAVFG